MTWWERWTFTLLHSVVAVTGVGYFYMKYAMTPIDPFAVINHPWQPALLSTHVVAAPTFIAFFGMVFRSHTLRKLLSQSAKHRRSGWTSLVGFCAMAATGYLLQVASSPAWITALVWTHVSASLVFVIGFGVHLAYGWRFNRAAPIAAGTVRRATQSPL